MIECTSEFILKKNKIKIKRKKRAKRIIIFVLVFAFIFIYQRFFVSKTIFNTCYDYFSASAVENVNNAVLNSLNDQLKYDDIIKLEKNNQGDITLIVANNYKINSLSRDITRLSKLEIEKTLINGVPVPWLAFLGIGYLSGIGNNVYVKTINLASVDCEFESNFISSGINQTLHSIYAIIKCIINVEIPLNKKEIEIKSKILLCESVIVGKVPNYYFDKNLL